MPVDKKINKPMPSYGKKLIDIISSSKFFRVFSVVFILQAAYFAIFTKLGTPPDEQYHLAYIQLFAQHSPSPILHGLEGHNILLEVTRNPFILYHYLTSFPYLIFKHLPRAYIYIRLINVALGFLSVLTLKKIASLLNLSSLVSNLATFMLTNTLMFVFISGSISYDPLYILLSLLSVMYLIKLSKEWNVKDVLLLVCIILAGCLTKINYLPIALSCGALGAYITVLAIRAKHVPQNHKEWLKECSGSRLLFIPIILLALLCSYFYVNNVIRYHTPLPGCERVIATSECEKNQIFTRNEYAFGPGRHTSTLGLPRYLIFWSSIMLQRTYGIFGSKRFDPFVTIEVLLALILIGGTIFAITNLNSPEQFYIIFIIATAGAALLLKNYNVFRHSGRPDFAVQGRYIFSVLPLLYLLISGAIVSKATKGKLTITLAAVLIITVFFASNIPTLLLKTSLGRL